MEGKKQRSERKLRERAQAAKPVAEVATIPMEQRIACQRAYTKEKLASILSEVARIAEHERATLEKHGYCGSGGLATLMLQVVEYNGRLEVLGRLG